MTDSVSVIIPAFNNSRTIQDTLTSLLGQKTDTQVEIVVIDDCSTDETRQISLSLGLKVIQNSSNLGLAASLNRGIFLTKNQLIVTLHADATPLSEDWLLELTAPLTRGNADVACSLQYPPILNRSNSGLWEKLLWGRLGAHHALNDKADAYRRTVLEQIGGFDQERFRTAGEDEDMALRLRLNNVRISSTDAPIRHNHVFQTRSESRVFLAIMAKEYSFGRCGGALRRKYVKHKPGAYIYPSVRSPINDGIFRILICFGSLVPYAQVLCIPALVISSLVGILSANNNTNLGAKLLLYPFFNIARFWCYSLGYLHGLITGKQE